MAARVGQFLTGHFPTGVYLHRFGHLPSPLCEGCGVPDTRAHMLLDCTRWTFQRERLRDWLQSERGQATEEGQPSPLGVGISLWVPQAAGYGLVVSSQPSNLVGLCGTSCRQIPVIVHKMGLASWGSW